MVSSKNSPSLAIYSQHTQSAQCVVRGMRHLYCDRDRFIYMWYMSVYVWMCRCFICCCTYTRFPHACVCVCERPPMSISAVPRLASIYSINTYICLCSFARLLLLKTSLVGRDGYIYFCLQK